MTRRRTKASYFVNKDLCLRQGKRTHIRGDIAMALHSEVSALLDSETCDMETPSLVRRKLGHSGDMRACASPTLTDLSITSRPMRDEHLTRLAALLTFCDPLPPHCLRMLNLSRKEWDKLLHWLDISGLALYFFNRLVELELCDLLPPAI